MKTPPLRAGALLIAASTLSACAPLVLGTAVGGAFMATDRRTAGIQLDVLARMPLWQAGYNYDHGTGHGVGHFLSVHEGPQRIAPKGSLVALQPGT